MRKIPIPLLLAGVFLTAALANYLFTVNTNTPPIWTTASNNTMVVSSPQTYFIFGSEFNRVADGMTKATVTKLGARVATIAVNDTQNVPWVIVAESQISGIVYRQGGLVASEGSVTWNIPMVLAMAYNESQLASMYGTNPICVTINGTPVTLQVNPSGAPGYIAMGYLLTTSYGSYVGAEVEYYYIGKVVTPNGFTWYMYLAAPVAGAATGKITLSYYGCMQAYSTTSFMDEGELTGWGTSGYLAQVSISPVDKGHWQGSYTFTQVANVTTSTTPVSLPAGSGSSIYGPNYITIGIAMPLESYALQVQGSVQIFYNP